VVVVCGAQRSTVRGIKEQSFIVSWADAMVDQVRNGVALDTIYNALTNRVQP